MSIHYLEDGGYAPCEDDLETSIPMDRDPDRVQAEVARRTAKLQREAQREQCLDKLVE